MKKLKKFECPVCGVEFDIDMVKYEAGDEIDCPKCGALLTITQKGETFTLVEVEQEEAEFVSSDDEDEG